MDLHPISISISNTDNQPEHQQKSQHQCCQWSAKMCGIFDIDPANLAEIKPSCYDFGSIKQVSDNRGLQELNSV